MKLKLLVVLLFTISFSFAQNPGTGEKPGFIIKNSVEPFLFSTSTLTPDNLPWTLSYLGSYGNNLSDGFGYNGINQQIGVKGYLGHRFTLLSFVALGIGEDNSVNSAQRAEIIRDLIGGKKSRGIRLGIGTGLSRDYGGVFALVGRITATSEGKRFKVGGNLLLEKALSGADRDELDVLTSLGVHYKITEHFFAGAEAVGEDLEGLWKEDEAEGGARIMFGPSVSIVPNRSRFSFSLSGGPALYLTRSTITNPDAIRDLPGENGMTVRARVIFDISGS